MSNLTGSGIAAESAGDAEEIRKIAHRLKGTAANYGFPEITETARICQDRLCEGARLEDIEQPLRELKQQILDAVDTHSETDSQGTSVANAVPVRMLPPELLAESEEQKQPIPFTWLRRPPSEEYRLASGDVLGVYIDGVIGDRAGVPPAVTPQSANVPPAMGFPFPIRASGTVALPLVPPLRVAGMTTSEAEIAIINAYSVERKIIDPNRERVLVTLLRPRSERVLVIREDNPQAAFQLVSPGQLNNLRGLNGIEANLTGGRQGTGTIVDLPAHENDILNALNRTGGLPGPDAVNEITVQRGGFRVDDSTGELAFDTGETVRIPLRLRPGEPLPFSPKDIILQTGDILYVKGRTAQFYYTAGLLPAGEVPLPRDYDLDVVEAVTRIGGPVLNGGLNSNNLSGGIVAHGLGNPSASLLTVLRRTPDGRQVNIRVDLNEALRDPRENILVQAGDVLLLQETSGEAAARYASSVLNLGFVGEIFRGGSGHGAASATLP